MPFDTTRRPVTTPFTSLHLDFPQPRPLDSGMTLWVLPGGDQQVCRLSVYFGGGTLQDSCPLQAFFTATLALEGSLRYDARQMAEQLDYYGAWKSAQCHDNMSEFILSTPTEYFGQVLPLLAEALAHPALPEQELALFKRRHAASVAVLNQRVKYLANIEMRRLYYGDGHPLAANVPPEQIMQLARDDLHRFALRYYRPEGGHIILAGQVTDEMVSLVERLPDGWRASGPAPSLDRPKICTSSPTTTVVNRPGAIQSAIEIVIPAIGREHPDYLPLRVLCMALGGYMGSRLMANIREQKGYTYGIRAYLAGREDSGYIGISTECDARYTHAVLDEIRHELEQLSRRPMEDSELDLVRQHILSDLAKTHDTPFKMADYVASTFLFGVYPEYYNRQVEAVRTVTPTRLQELAGRYLDPAQMRVAIAGDKRELRLDV